MKKLNRFKLQDLIFLAHLIGEGDDFIYDALKSVKYYRGDKHQRKELLPMQTLETKWYDSLNAGAPDYDLYKGREILADMWACWVVYSREYLRMIVSPKSRACCDSNQNWQNFKSIAEEIGNPDYVLDLGCGIGYTTAALKEIFPYATVMGTNMIGSAQYHACVKVAAANNFTMVGSLGQCCKRVEVIFASEYFEHFQSPIQHLEEVLKLEPKVMLIANAFTSRSMGHFPQYLHEGQWYEGKKISRMFNDRLREAGYEKQSTHCWNDRPAYWRKN